MGKLIVIIYKLKIKNNIHDKNRLCKFFGFVYKFCIFLILRFIFPEIYKKVSQIYGVFIENTIVNARYKLPPKKCVIFEWIVKCYNMTVLKKKRME